MPPHSYGVALLGGQKVTPLLTEENTNLTKKVFTELLHDFQDIVQV